MSEGGMPTEVPTPERGQQNPTEAPKGLLGKVANEAQRIVGEIKEGSRDPFGVNFPQISSEAEKTAATEASKKSPTETSKEFLRKFTDRLFTDRANPAEFMLRTGTSAFLTREAIEDVMQGNYPSAAVKGIIAGISAVSPIRSLFSSR